MFDRILVPLDGSERAEAILTHIAPFLRAADAELVVLAVVEGADAQRKPDIALLDAARERAERYVESVRERLAEAGLRATSSIRPGRPATQILAAAEEVEADLIALASHGYGGLERLFYGSTAERVLRASDVPVLLVKSWIEWDDPADRYEALPLEPIGWRDILVPLDGSREAEWALPLAAKLARSQQGRVHLLRVVPILPRTGFWIPPPEGGPDAGGEKDYLALLADGLNRSGVETRTFVAHGAVIDAIRAYVDEHTVGLIAMTTHGRSGWSRWMLGSVSESLLRSLHTPILLRRITQDVGAAGGG